MVYLERKIVKLLNMFYTFKYCNILKVKCNIK